MRKFFVATVAAFVLVSGSAFAADGSMDYTNKEKYSCDKDDVETEMTSLAENGRAGKAGINLIYVKSSAEVLRKSDELRCKVVAVYSIGTVSGIFTYKNEDGHALVGFNPGAKK